MKKSIVRKLIATLSGALLLTLSATACKNWMTSDDFMSEIENEVFVANAKKINVECKFANSKQGETFIDKQSLNGQTQLKVEVTSGEFSCTVADSYGFYKWAAFCSEDVTDEFLRNILFVSETDYSDKFAGLELGEEVITIETPDQTATKVKVHEERNDIVLIPIVASRPAISTSLPAQGASGVVRNMALRIVFSKPMDESTLISTDSNGNKVLSENIDILRTSGDFENMTLISIKDIFTQVSLGETKRTLTIRLDPSKVKTGLPSNTSIRVTVSKDVTDTYGYQMESNDYIAFTTGTGFDSLAPRIDGLRAGPEEIGAWGYSIAQALNTSSSTVSFPAISLSDLKDEKIGDATTTYGNIQNSQSAASVNDEGVLAHRTTGNVNLWVYAKDITETSAGTDEVEADVYMLMVEATHLFFMDGTADDGSDEDIVSKIARKSYSYTSGERDDVISSDILPPIISAATANTEEKREDKGYMIGYDLSSMPDGLIRIDVGAVDIIGNDSFTGTCVSTTAGKDNRVRSIYVIKDNTAPDASLFMSKIDQVASATENGWFNKETFSSFSVQEVSGKPIADSGDIHLRARREDMEWALRISNGSTPGWEKIDANNPPTYALTGSNGTDGRMGVYMQLRDDMGNTSSDVLIKEFNYDQTKPAVGTLDWVDSSYERKINSIKSADLAENDTLLEIPFTESLSGIKKVRIKVIKDGTSTVISQNRASGTRNYFYYNGTETKAITAVNSVDSENRAFDVLNTSSATFTSGKLYVSGLLVGTEECSYKVIVDLIDAANNISSTKEILIINDKTKPVINSVQIKDLKEQIIYGNSAKTYWLPSSAFAAAGESATKATLKINYTESNSGVCKITLGKDIKLTSASKLQVVSGSSATDVAVTEYTLNVSANSITLKDYNNPKVRGDKSYFQITNVSFNNTGDTPNEISVSLTDFVGNVIAAATTKVATAVNSNGGATATVSNIFADSTLPSLTVASDGITDIAQKTVDASNPLGVAANYKPATYTDSVNVNFKLTLGAEGTAGSGIKSITLDGAEFLSDTSIEVDGTPLQSGDYTATAGSKTVTFTKVFTAANVISFKKIKISSATEGTKTISAKVTDLAGWTVAAAATDTIILDTTAPAITKLSWTANAGVAGVVTGKLLSDQNLIIDFTEATTGVKRLRVQVKLPDGTEYADPLKDTGLVVKNNSTALTKDTDYTIEENKFITLKTPVTTGTISITGITINDSAAEGEYTISVTVNDAAENIDVTAPTSSKKTSISNITIANDSTNPVIEKVEIPGLKKATELVTNSITAKGTSSTDKSSTFWLDSEYIGDTYPHDRNFFATKGKIYITINEAGSGVSKITLENTGTAEFQPPSSKVYMVASDGTETEISSSKYTMTTTTITIKDSSDSLRNATGESKFVIMLDNIKFTKTGGDTGTTTAGQNMVHISVSDVALNVSDKSTEMTAKATGQTTTYFWTDSWQCAMDTLYLHDSDTVDGTASTNKKAVDNYTNSDLITISASLGAEGTGTSGHNKFVLTNAKFTAQTKAYYALSGSNASTAYGHFSSNFETSSPSNYYGGEIDHDYITISADGRTLELKKADETEYLVFRNNAAIRFTNVQLDDTTDGLKTVYIQAYDLAGWNNTSGARKSKSITLDKTKPDWRNDSQCNGIFASAYEKYKTGTYANNIYPHPNDTHATGVTISGKKNGDGNDVSYFYTSAKIGTDENAKYGAVLGIPCYDATQLRGYKGKDCVSYVVYEHDDSATATMDAATVIANGTIPSEDINENTTGKGNYTDWIHNFNGWTFFEAGKTYSIVVVDEAGNYSSTAQTVTIVQDTTQPSLTYDKSAYTAGGTKSLGNLVSIDATDYGKVFRNTVRTAHAVKKSDNTSSTFEMNSNTFDYGSVHAIDYVIKNSTYEIKINLGTAIAGLTQLDGTSTTPNAKYAETEASTTSSPLDMYAVTHRYRQWPDSVNGTDYPYRPAFPEGTVSPNGKDLFDLFGYKGDKVEEYQFTSNVQWRKYAANSSSYLDDGITHKVDSDGNIVITLPTSTLEACPPLALLLKDGTGNLNYMLIKPVSMESNESDSVVWLVDNKIGEGNPGRNIGMNTYMAETAVAGYGKAPVAIKLNGEPLQVGGVDKQFYWGHRTSTYQPGSETLTSGVTGIGVIAPDVYSNTTYYNDNAYLGLYNKAESCTFASAYRHGTAPADGKYTLRARVRAWDVDGKAPKPDDFINVTAGQEADYSSWVYLRDVSSSGNNDYVLQYPHPTRTEKFRLYYYVEDAVGNYEINTVVNDSADTMIYWVYDNAGPSVKTRSEKRNPSSITGAEINELIASNNGFTPYRNSDTVYVAKTDKQRTGYSLPAQSKIGRGVSLGAIGNGLKWGNYFDLDITEASGIRAFTYTTTTDQPPAYTKTGGTSMGDAEATGKWYCGPVSAIDKSIGSAATYQQNSKGTIYTASDGELYYDYYLPDYGRTKYSGVKVCETIPYGLVGTTATDLYLHVMDWVGNITTVRLGTGALGAGGIKWAADEEPANDNNGTIDEHMPGWRIQSYNGEDNIKNDLHYTIAATKIASDATSLKIYFPEGHFIDAGSGLLGWSLTPDDKTSIQTDDATDYKKSYIEIDGTKLSSIKLGSEAGTIKAYVYDKLGWSHEVVLKLTGDAVLPNMTPYIRGVKSGAFALSFVKESMGSSYGLSNNNNPVGTECVSSTLYNTEAEIAAHARTVYTIGETAVFLFNSPSGDNYNATVSHWNGSKWVLDADLLTEKHGEGATNWWVETGWYSSKQIKNFSSGSYYRYTVIDNNGNENYAYIKLIKDTDAPAIAIVKDAVTGKDKIQNVNQIEVSGTKKNYFNDQAKVTLQYTDTESGISTYPGLASPYTSYVTTTPEFEYTLKNATITSGVIKIAGATDNLRQSADAELKYNNVGYWVYDTTAPTVSSLATQTAEYNIWWKPANNFDNKYSANFEITETTIPDGENQYKAKLTATKSSTSSTNVSTSGVKTFKFKPASASTDLLGWLVEIVDSSETANPPAFTAANDIKIAKDAYYEFTSVPADDKKCFFYPIDYAGNAGSPYVLTFAAAITPELTYINAKSEGKDLSGNTISNYIIQQKDPSNPGSTQNYYYYNENSRLTVSVKNPSNKTGITVKSFTLEFKPDKNSGDNSHKKDFTLTTPVTITAGTTATFTLPLDGMCGILSEISGAINKQYFTVYVNTDFASSKGKQFSSTPFIYEGTGPESISISLVESQSGNFYVRKDDGTTVSYGNNASKIIITPTATDTVGVAGYSIAEDGTYGSTVEFTTASLPATPKIWAKDKLGNKSSQTITLTLDNAVTDVNDIIVNTPDSGNGVYLDTANKKLYFNTTSIKVTPSTSDTDIAYFYYNDAANKSAADGSITIDNPADGDFTFYAVDMLGNVSSNGYTITFEKDVTVTTPTATYKYYLDDTEVAADSGFVYVGASTTYYNSNKINKIVFTPSVASDASGIVGYATSDTATEWKETVSVSNPGSVTIYAKDKVGNVSEALTFSFTADGTAPKPSDSNVSGIKLVNYTYPDNSLKYGYDHEVGANYISNYFNSDFTIKFTASDVSGGCGLIGYALGVNDSDSVAPSVPSTFVTVESDSITIPNAKIPDPGVHGYLWLFLKDNVGNVSSYLVPNPSTPTYTWMKKYSAITSSSVSNTVDNTGTWTNQSGSVVRTVSVTITGLTPDYAVSEIKLSGTNGSFQYVAEGGYGSSSISYEATAASATVGGKTVDCSITDNVVTIAKPYVVIGGKSMVLTITEKATAADGNAHWSIQNTSNSDYLPSCSLVSITDNFGATYTVPVVNASRFGIRGISLGSKTKKAKAVNSTSVTIKTVDNSVPVASSKNQKVSKKAAAAVKSVNEVKVDSLPEIAKFESVDVESALNKVYEVTETAGFIKPVEKSAKIEKNNQSHQKNTESVALLYDSSDINNVTMSDNSAVTEISESLTQSYPNVTVIVIVIIGCLLICTGLIFIIRKFSKDRI